MPEGEGVHGGGSRRPGSWETAHRGPRREAWRGGKAAEGEAWVVGATRDRLVSAKEKVSRTREKLRVGYVRKQVQFTTDDPDCPDPDPDPDPNSLTLTP